MTLPTLTPAAWDDWLFSPARQLRAYGMSSRFPDIFFRPELSGGVHDRLSLLLGDLWHWGDHLAGAVVVDVLDGAALRHAKRVAHMILPPSLGASGRAALEAMERLQRLLIYTGRAWTDTYWALEKVAGQLQFGEPPIVVYPSTRTEPHRALWMPFLAPNIVRFADVSTTPNNTIVTLKGDWRLP